MPNLYNSFSVVLLGLFGNPTMNGLYDAGKKLPITSYQFTGVIARTFFPYLSRNSSKHSLFAKLYLGISFFVALMLFVLSKPLLLLFYTKEFVAAVPIMRLMSVSLVFLAMSSVYGTNYLLVKNKDKILRNITIIASLVGFALSFPLIKYYGIIGATITFLTPTVIMGVLSMIIAILLRNKEKL